MVTVCLSGGVSIRALVCHVRLEQSCDPQAFQEPYNGHCQQLHFVQHFIQKVECNVLSDGHRHLEIWQSVLQLFSQGKQPSLQRLRMFRLPQSCWMHWVPHEIACVQGTYFVFSSNESNDAEEHIYSEVKSCDWWWNEQVRWLNYIIATMMLPPSIATAAAWSYGYPFIRQFRPDTSHKLFVWRDGVATIFESQKHWLDV